MLCIRYLKATLEKASSQCSLKQKKLRIWCVARIARYTCLNLKAS